MTKEEALKEITEGIAKESKAYKELEEENRKLNEEIENHKQNIMQDELEIIPKLEEENKKLKETIKDHQLYEEKLEHRIIELEELLHGE